MTAKAIVFTLGFDVTSIITRLSEIGLEGDEHLIFIVSESSSQRALATQKSLENHIAMLNSRGFKLTYEFLKLNEDTPILSIANTYRVLSKHQNIIVELSGGMRYLILVTFLAAMIVGGNVLEVATRLESDSRHITIPIFEPKPLTHPEARVLKELKETGPQNQRQLAAILGRKISSISRSLAKLTKAGFTSISPSHPRVYTITPLGEIFLEYYKTKNQKTEQI
jgi:CRISPR locus-related DNA-binding protein